MKLLKIQMALQNLREDPPDIDEFEKCVKLLFLSSRGKVAVVEPALADTYKELMAVANSKGNPKIIEKILQKYGKDGLLRTFDQFVHTYQPPVMLDAIMTDIDTAFYVPRIAPSIVNAVNVVDESVEVDDDEIAECSRATQSKELRIDEAKRHVQLSAWQLRKGLGLADDEAQWNAIHQVCATCQNYQILSRSSLVINNAYTFCYLLFRFQAV